MTVTCPVDDVHQARLTGGDRGQGIGYPEDKGGSGRAAVGSAIYNLMSHKSLRNVVS